MRIIIYDGKNNQVEKIEFKLLQLCTGPSRQDHLLKKMKARLSFDIRITQRMSVNLTVNRFELNFNEISKKDKKDFGYSFSLKVILGQI